MNLVYQIDRLPVNAACALCGDVCRSAWGIYDIITVMRRFFQTAFPVLLVTILTVCPATAATTLPAHEWTMLRQVAAEYSLSNEETWLLAAIRLHENGRPGLEFGVGGPMNSGHSAHRYRDGIKSFRVQCAWAAGTIKKRYTGDLRAFGKRYNPLHAATWTKNVTAIIAQLKRHHKGVLP